MEYTINKDLLIQVLREQNQELKELVQLQKERLEGYKQYEEIVTQRQATMERREEVMEQLNKAYSVAIVAMEGQLKALSEQNIELTRNLEEVQASMNTVAGEAK